MGGERYALDINLAREIVEMIPITPIPGRRRSSPVLSTCGEITNIMNLNTLLGLPGKEVRDNQKIIVLVPEAAKGNNVGIIVDDVSSVRQVPETDIEHIGAGSQRSSPSLSRASSRFQEKMRRRRKRISSSGSTWKKCSRIWLTDQKAALATGIVHEAD